MVLLLPRTSCRAPLLIPLDTQLASAAYSALELDVALPSFGDPLVESTNGHGHPVRWLRSSRVGREYPGHIPYAVAKRLEEVGDAPAHVPIPQSDVAAHDALHVDE